MGGIFRTINRKALRFHIVFRWVGSLPAAVVEEMRNEREIVRKLQEPKNQRERDLLRKLQWGYFRRFDALLDGRSTGPHWLRQPKIADLVKEAIHFRDSKVFQLLAYSIMPNHVHMVIQPVLRTGLVLQVAREDTSEAGLVRRVADPTPEDQIAQNEHGQRDSVPSDGLTDILASLKKYIALRANRVLHRTGPSWQGESYDQVIRDDNELDRTIWYVLQNPVTARLAQSWEQWPWNYCKWNPL